MKQMKKLIATAVCGAILALAIGASAQSIKQGIATVVRIQGEASYKLSATDTPHPLVAGKILTAGAIIHTAPDAIVDVVLGKSIAMPQAAPTPDRIAPAPDSLVRGSVSYTPSAEQNVIRLSGGTTLAIDKLTVSDTGADTVSDTELDLQQGHIFASVKKLSAASQYLIKIPNGIAGVRGTLFSLGADGSCAVIKNSVVLSLIINGVPVTMVVGEGNQFNPGNAQITPLPPEISNLLHFVATALDTLYLEVVSFSYDRTLSYVSPTSGHSGSSQTE